LSGALFVERSVTKKREWKAEKAAQKNKDEVLNEVHHLPKKNAQTEVRTSSTNKQYENCTILLQKIFIVND